VDPLTSVEIAAAVRTALAEDVGPGDVTTLATVPESLTAAAAMVAREPLTLAGLAFAEETFHQLSPATVIERTASDGQKVERDGIILKVLGTARALLTAERVALNFVQRLSGIATLTAKYAGAIEGMPARVLDTRKTTPGWRRFEKYAVTCGGGHNHRIGLFDLVLIKDNHLAALRGEQPNAIAAAVQRARRLHPDLRVEVEADTLDQVEQAIAAGADILLLDNMAPPLLRKAVEMVAGRAKTEASGGVNLDTVRAIAETGVDFISVGALTHSAPAVDIALDFAS
jgi:nicotinate-nucleotide pyrophosphorylase (carboxylating)